MQKCPLNLLQVMLFQLHRTVWGLEGSPGESLQYLREASSQLPVLFEILRQGMCLQHEIPSLCSQTRVSFCY